MMDGWPLGSIACSSPTANSVVHVLSSVIVLVLAPFFEPVHLLQEHGVLVVLICDCGRLPDPQLLRDVDKANQGEACVEMG